MYLSTRRVRALWRQETESAAWRMLVARALLAPVPHDVGTRLRSIVLRAVGFRIGPRTIMMGTPTITGPPGVHRRLLIGSDCSFNVACHLEAGAEIVIEDRVALGHEVLILTTSHEANDPFRRAGDAIRRPVRIAAGAWLGSRSLVLPGVSIGRGAVVGAGALVNRDVPPHTVVGGVPARVIRRLFPGEGDASDPAPSEEST